MNIKIRESLFIKGGNTEHTVRVGTTGIEKKGIIYFYDTTRTCAIGFQRAVCLENPKVFSVERVLSDREIPLRDILSVVEKVGDKNIREGLIEEIKAL